VKRPPFVVVGSGLAPPIRGKACRFEDGAVIAAFPPPTSRYKRPSSRCFVCSPFPSYTFFPIYCPAPRNDRIAAWLLTPRRRFLFPLLTTPVSCFMSFNSLSRPPDLHAIFQFFSYSGTTCHLRIPLDGVIGSLRQTCLTRCIHASNCPLTASTCHDWAAALDFRHLCLSNCPDRRSMLAMRHFIGHVHRHREVWPQMTTCHQRRNRPPSGVANTPRRRQQIVHGFHGKLIRKITNGPVALDPKHG
jgi:hypothetical protein